jgi:hypothetical protein
MRGLAMKMGLGGADPLRQAGGRRKGGAGVSLYRIAGLPQRAQKAATSRKIEL